MVCRYCGYNMSDGLRLCPKCRKATKYFNKNAEKALLNELNRTKSTKGKRSLLSDYSEEEQLVLGLYPKDETYKMSLISRILGRR